MSAHTPGPWEYSDEDDEPCVVAGDYYVATALVGQLGDGIAVAPQAHANAHLIAAAPELLAATRELLAGHAFETQSSGGGCPCHACGTGRAAIAKAEGKS